MKKSVVREYFEALVIAVALALFVRTWVFQAFKIPTGSMEPGLLVGDHLIVNKMVFSPAVTGLERALLPRRDIERGDVVVFKYPEDPGRDFIKRVVGLPGDRIEIRRQTLYVNGEPIEEPFVSHLLPPPPPDAPRSEDVRLDYGPVTVPSQQYFMMGDNRDNSQDSRFWGFLPASYVKGQALFIYLSAGDSFGQLRWSRMLDRVR